MTITPKQIETAIGQRLAAMAGVPTIAWPNMTIDPARPFLHVAFNPVSRTDDSVAGGFDMALGIVLVTAITAIDQFSNAANDLAADIQAQFPMGLRMEVSGAGNVLIYRPCEAVSPFRDGQDWRQPVRIHYQTENA